MGGKRKILAVVCIIIFLFIKFSTLSYQNSDENTYFYMAKLMAEGKLPYRDFFFAHPPLQVAIYSLFLKVFGMHVFLLKSIEIIFSLLTGLGFTGRNHTVFGLCL